ncbi:MAG: DUF3253 domain-containing protein [Maribacter sp.]
MIKVTRAEIADAHLHLAAQRGLSSTYCPSEIAQELFPDHWRDKMTLVRDVADELVEANKIVVLQKGVIISENANEAKGPIRLRKK